jgi:hypothetical protein
MTSSIAQRRALKAARRRKIGAKKHRHEGAAVKTPSAVRVRRWAAAPIHCCPVHKQLFEMGIGIVVLARRLGTDQLAMASFLVDVYCRGIKDAAVQRLGRPEFEGLFAMMAEVAPNKPVQASYARKLLRDCAEYANSLGFLPHRDFAVAEELFGDVCADACDAAFRFGRDGKPAYMAGPYESQASIRKTLGRLRKRLGDGGFTYIAPADEIELTDDFLDDDFLDTILLDEASAGEIPF